MYMVLESLVSFFGLRCIRSGNLANPITCRRLGPPLVTSQEGPYVLIVIDQLPQWECMWALGFVRFCNHWGFGFRVLP